MQTHERVDELLTLAPDAMIAVAGGRVTAANERAAALFGYPLDDLVGRPVDDLLPAPVRAVPARRRSGRAGRAPPRRRYLPGRGGGGTRR